MSDDLWNKPTTKAWVRYVVEDMVPKMQGSAAVIQIVPDDPEADVKFWVELGASIMLDKPIVAVVFGDRPIKPKLAAIADEIVRLPDGVNVTASTHLAAAIARVTGTESKDSGGGE